MKNILRVVAGFAIGFVFAVLLEQKITQNKWYSHACYLLEDKVFKINVEIKELSNKKFYPAVVYLSGGYTLLLNKWFYNLSQVECPLEESGKK